MFDVYFLFSYVILLRPLSPRTFRIALKDLHLYMPGLSLEYVNPIQPYIKKLFTDFGHISWWRDRACVLLEAVTQLHRISSEGAASETELVA